MNIVIIGHLGILSSDIEKAAIKKGLEVGLVILDDMGNKGILPETHNSPLLELLLEQLSGDKIEEFALVDSQDMRKEKVRVQRKISQTLGCVLKKPPVKKSFFLYRIRNLPR